MKLFYAILLLLTYPAFGASAPETIAGTVLRTASTLNRLYFEETIVFQEEGRFTHIKNAAGQTPPFADRDIAFLQSPRSDGRYLYERRISQRVDDPQAIVTLSGDDGTTSTISLFFETATEGKLSGIPQAGSDSWFSFSSVSAWRAAPARNVSMRGRVTPGRPLIVGFIVPGTESSANTRLPPPGIVMREIVIRAVGPGLASFGLSDTWADPDFQLFKGNAAAVVKQPHHGDWSASDPVWPNATRSAAPALEKIFDFLGAFPLPPNSKDAVDVVQLTPGAYTIVCNAPAGDPGGDVLIEVYFLP